MNRPAISVCILTCNQARYIEQCLQSVLVQTNDVSLEILVGDDASDDGTSEIVAALAASRPGVIKHFRHPRRLGASTNYQAILQHVKGDFVAHLDGDDYWLPGKLRKQLDYMAGHPDCAAVYSNARTVTEDNRPVGLFNDVRNAQFSLSDMLSRGNFLNTSSMLFRAELRGALLEIEGPFIDYRIHLRHARRGSLAHLAEPLVGYRINAAGSMMANSNPLVRKLYWEAILDALQYGIEEKVAAKALADFMRRVFFRSLRTRSTSLLREWLPCVSARAPYGPGLMAALTFESIMRTACIELFGRVRLGPGGTHIKVLYRR